MKVNMIPVRLLVGRRLMKREFGLLLLFLE
jgi:hypothetical protein